MKNERKHITSLLKNRKTKTKIVEITYSTVYEMCHMIYTLSPLITVAHNILQVSKQKYDSKQAGTKKYVSSRTYFNGW